MRTFKYTGKSSSLFVETKTGNIELKKGEPYSTDDSGIISRLLEHPDIKEMGLEEDKKPSKKASGVQ